MQRSSQTRLIVVLLGLFTVAAIIFASVNLSKENSYEVPTDGVRWAEVSSGLLAKVVPAGSPGEQAGIKTGDLLVAAKDRPVNRMSTLVRRSGSGLAPTSGSTTS